MATYSPPPGFEEETWENFEARPPQDWTGWGVIATANQPPPHPTFQEVVVCNGTAFNHFDCYTELDAPDMHMQVSPSSIHISHAFSGAPLHQEAIKFAFGLRVYVRDPTGVPEPSSFSLLVVAFMAVCLLASCRRLIRRLL